MEIPKSIPFDRETLKTLVRVVTEIKGDSDQTARKDIIRRLGEFRVKVGLAVPLKR